MLFPCDPTPPPGSWPHRRPSILLGSSRLGLNTPPSPHSSPPRCPRPFPQTPAPDPIPSRIDGHSDGDMWEFEFQSSRKGNSPVGTHPAKKEDFLPITAPRRSPPQSRAPPLVPIFTSTWPPPPPRVPHSGPSPRRPVVQPPAPRTHAFATAIPRTGERSSERRLLASHLGLGRRRRRRRAAAGRVA